MQKNSVLWLLYAKKAIQSPGPSSIFENTPCLKIYNLSTMEFYDKCRKAECQ